MYNNYRIVLVTPSGRRKYQSILFKYIEKYSAIIDEYRIWVNTKNINDINWFKNLEKKYDWVTLDTREYISGNRSINQFFNKCIDNNTIYIRLDDDILYLDSNFLQNLIECRIAHPEYFLVYGNIINNGICSFFHQRHNIININCILKYNAMSNLWASGLLAEQIHNIFIDDINNNDTKKYQIDNRIISNKHRFSINAISWFGAEFSKFNGYINSKEDEEKFLTQLYPSSIEKNNFLCGSAICSHFAYYPQRKYLDTKDIIHKYSDIATKVCS